MIPLVSIAYHSAPLKSLTPSVLFGDSPLPETFPSLCWTNPVLNHSPYINPLTISEASSGFNPDCWCTVESKGGQSGPDALSYPAACCVCFMLPQFSVELAALAAGAYCCLMPPIWSTGTPRPFSAQPLSVCFIPALFCCVELFHPSYRTLCFSFLSFTRIFSVYSAGCSVKPWRAAALPSSI